MNCLCCGKIIKSEDINGWHKSCIKKFFGTTTLPSIEISNKTLEELASQSTSNGLTVTGVQKKLSLHLLSDGHNARLTLVNYPTGYILKPAVNEFPAMPEAEQLVMTLADITGIKTVPHALINTGSLSYITKRVDRIFEDSTVQCLAMEDFCQLDERLTQDKYKGSCERCAKIIEKYSCQKMLDMSELFIRLIFCYITGNSDMHLKNFSLMESSFGSGKYVLSPAYDLLPVNIIMPEDKEEFAIPINGKKTNIRKKDFLIFADYCKIERKTAENIIKKIVSLKEKYIELCENSLITQDMKIELENLISKRCETLSC